MLNIKKQWATATNKNIKFHLSHKIMVTVVIIKIGLIDK
jgi:hypothetical protein